MLDTITIPVRSTNCSPETGVDPDIFTDPTRVREAIATCKGCWFTDECRKLGEGEYGVWGGEVSADLAVDRTNYLSSEILTRLQDGESERGIARDLDVSYFMVRKLAREAELPGRCAWGHANCGALDEHTTERRDAAIVGMIREGHTPRDVCRKFIITRAAFDRAVERAA